MKLVVDQLQKRFGTQEVLRGASFTFEQGKIYGLIGRNGAGKTTFFNCLNEDLAADGGSFHLEDDTGAARPVTADDMGYVLSTPVVPEFLTAREFLQFFLEINRGKIPYPKAPDVHRPGRPGKAAEGFLPRHEKQDADAGEHHGGPRRAAAGRAADLL